MRIRSDRGNAGGWKIDVQDYSHETQDIPSRNIIKVTAGMPLAGDGIVRVGRETKGRKGKCVTLVTGISLDPDGFRDLTRQLKQRCGTGGTVKAGVIQIQGDHRDALVEELKARGYRVKRSGG